MAKKRPHVETCSCEHAGMWHKPDCRIAGCDCESFERATIVRNQRDGSWMSQGHQRPRKTKWGGPNA